MSPLAELGLRLALSALVVVLAVSGILAPPAIAVVLFPLAGALALGLIWLSVRRIVANRASRGVSRTAPRQASLDGTSRVGNRAQGLVFIGTLAALGLVALIGGFALGGDVFAVAGAVMGTVLLIFAVVLLGVFSGVRATNKSRQDRPH